MEKKFYLAAGTAFGERRRLSSETVDEQLIDDIVAQFGAGDEAKLCARLYKHSMFAAKEVQPRDLQGLRERTLGIARIGQGFEGVVEVLSDANGNLCIQTTLRDW